MTRPMARRDVRQLAWLTLILAIPACQTTPERQCSLVSRVPVTDLVDPHVAADTVPVLDVKVVESLAAQTQGSGVTPVAATSGRKPFNVLVLSGGGAYGAYSAGVLA